MSESVTLADISVSIGTRTPWRAESSEQMQAILRAGLDDEGIIFTFHLPMMVLAECEA